MNYLLEVHKLVMTLLVSRPKFPGMEKRFQLSNQSSSLAKRDCQELSSSVVTKSFQKGLYNNYCAFLGRYGPVINYMYSMLYRKLFWNMFRAKLNALNVGTL